MSNIRIVDYSSEYNDAIVSMNEAWISEHWEIEPKDIEELEHISDRIINRGGFVLVALDGDEPVGTCSMLAMDGEKYDYELGKFTTSAKVRGRGVGRMLIAEALRRAKALGKSRIYLETNHLCCAAIHIYESFGFNRLPGVSKVFDRGDCRMERIEDNTEGAV